MKDDFEQYIENTSLTEVESQISLDIVQNDVEMAENEWCLISFNKSNQS